MRTVLVIALASLPGCEYFMSDVATRVRYALRDEAAQMKVTGDDTSVVELRPNHRPDACPKGEGYRLVLSPYKGNKQVPAADIDVFCAGGHHYWTGTRLIIPKPLEIVKGADEPVRLTLKKIPEGIAVVALE